MVQKIAIVVVVLIVISILFYLVQKSVLNKAALYTYTRPQEVFRLLDEPLTRLCIPKRDRLLMRISPLIVMDNENELEWTVAQLTKLKLSEQNVIGLSQKMLEYYVSKNKRNEAESMYQQLAQILGKEPYLSDPKYVSIRNEAEQLEQIYVLRNEKYLEEELKNAVAAPAGAPKAIYYYRCARLCFYKKEYGEMKKFLLLAQAECKGSKLCVHIQAILDGDFQRIEEM